MMAVVGRCSLLAVLMSCTCNCSARVAAVYFGVV